MKIIKYVYHNTYSSFIFILLLNFLAISVYSILGMQLYKDKFDLTITSNLERNFDSFEKAFITVFSVIIMENWDSILIECMKVDQITSFFFMFSMIFFLSFMMFNMLTTVLIHGFETLIQGDLKVYGGKLKEEYDLFKVKQILLKYNSIKERIDKTSSFFQNSFENDHDNYNFFESKRSTRQTALQIPLGSPIYDKMIAETASKLLSEQIKRKKKFYLLDFDFKNMNSFFLFNEKSFIRKICRKINKKPIFHLLAYINLILSLIFISIETFLNYSINSQINIKGLCHVCNILIYFFFTVETMIKSIDLGFILSANAYLRTSANLIDFFSVIGFYIEILIVLSFEEPYIRLSRWSLFRVLRAINITYQSEKMKFLLKAIFKSLHGLLSVTLIVLTVW